LDSTVALRAFAPWSLTSSLSGIEGHDSVVKMGSDFWNFRDEAQIRGVLEYAARKTALLCRAPADSG
jgi:hypothetical protein